ncbi:universal stress protein [Halorubrum rutilum]|uniref:Universal stress protein n=1 Tax=Halorubrum rutilum TaxID=1364933 RepID=A0ABD6AGK8_9EURY|nr:universal stress protein [Halorubrum rutilum]
MYGTTLIPTGGSDAAFAAVDDAIEVTAPDGAIHVLGVVEELPTYERSGTPGVADGGDDEAERLRLEAAVERIETEATAAEIDCETAIAEGVPSREIVAYAEDVDADAIVMGTRGARDAAGDLLGSTTERVLRDASTTVVSVPASA